MEEKKDQEEKMVEIARYTFPADAQTLVALLKSEGIDCYIRNELSTQMYAGYIDVGCARVELLESEVEHALEVMKDNGYQIPEEDEQPEQIKKVAGWASHIPFLKNLPLEKQILFFFVIIAVLLTALVFLYPVLVSK